MKDKKSMRGRLIKWSLRHASRIRSLNSAMSNELMALCGPIKIHEVNNRVDFKVFSCPKTDYCLSGSRLRLVSAGRLVWEKNYINLINNLKSYSADNWDLTIIGEGPMRSEIEEFILNNNLTKKVKLLGSRGQSEMASIISSSDIYIQYSISEAVPRTILEAMALGLPIITTDAGFIRGIITDSVNGLLISTDGTELSLAVSILASDGQFRQKIGRNALSDARRLYEWESCFSRYRHMLCMDSEQ